MDYRQHLALLFFILVSFSWTTWGSEENPARTPLRECTESLVVVGDKYETLASPIGGLDFNQYLEKLYASLTLFPKNTREYLIAYMLQDATGPKLEIRQAIFSYLCEKFRYTSKPEKLRLQFYHLDNRIDTLAHQLRVRELLRFYGSSNLLFQTPLQIKKEIAELFAKLEDDHEQDVALGMLPSLKHFPAWGREALTGAFQLLGFSDKKIQAILKKKINQKQVLFFSRDQKNRFALARYGYPSYFYHYEKLETVKNFICYINKKIKEGINLKFEEELKQPTSTPTPEARSTEEKPEAIITKALISEEQEKQTKHKQEITNALEKIKKLMQQTKLDSKEVDKLKTPEWYLQELDTYQRTYQRTYQCTYQCHQKPKAQISENDRIEFLNFFNELSLAFQERKQAIETFKHLAISEGNMLIIGPTGVSKTKLIRTFLKGIRSQGKTSYAEIKLSQDSTVDDIKGPYDPRALLNESRYERNYDQGVYESYFVNIDEIDKARPKLQPALFDFLADRIDATGPNIRNAKTKIVIGSANKYLNQLYFSPNITPEEVQPYIDRFDYVIFIPGELQFVSSSNNLTKPYEFLKTLELSTLERIQNLLQKVIIPPQIILLGTRLFFEMRDKTIEEEIKTEINFIERSRDLFKPPLPYKSSKIYSPRTQKKFLGHMLRTTVVLRALENPESSLEANFDDLIKNAKQFLIMSGIDSDSTSHFLKQKRRAAEKEQYKHIEFENGVLDTVTRTTKSEIRQFATSGYEGKISKINSEIQTITTELRTQTQNSLDSTLLERIKKLSENIDQLKNNIVISSHLPELNTALRIDSILMAENLDKIKQQLLVLIQNYLIFLELVHTKLSNEL